MKRYIYLWLVLSILVSSVGVMPPNTQAWTTGEMPALCPAGSWDTWRADWESMTSVDLQPTMPPVISSDYLVTYYTDGIPYNSAYSIYVWNEPILAGTEEGTSQLYFPESKGGGYTLVRWTDVNYNNHLDDTIWRLPAFGNPDTLFSGNHVGCIVAAGGIISHPDHPYVGDTSWFNYDPPVDSTPPVISAASMNPQLILFRGKVTFSAKTSDAQSGVSGGEFYIDKDPGKGKGTSMEFKDGKIRGTTTVKKLRPGVHTLSMRSVDQAGNWSKTVSKKFLYIGF